MEVTPAPRRWWLYGSAPRSSSFPQVASPGPGSKQPGHHHKPWAWGAARTSPQSAGVAVWGPSNRRGATCAAETTLWYLTSATQNMSGTLLCSSNCCCRFSALCFLATSRCTRTSRFAGDEMDTSAGKGYCDMLVWDWSWALLQGCKVSRGCLLALCHPPCSLVLHMFLFTCSLHRMHSGAHKGALDRACGAYRADGMGP